MICGRWIKLWQLSNSNRLAVIWRLLALRYVLADEDSNFVQGKLGGDVQVFNHIFEFLEANTSVEV